MASAKLTNQQQAQVRTWAEEGADMNAIQDRLKNDLGITLTFMETRFLLSDLNITLRQEQEESSPEPESVTEPSSTNDDAFEDTENAIPEFEDDPLSASKVTLTVDEITIPGSIASGKVTFTDGKTASWYLDQMGRLGLSGVERTYQPPEADFIAFQKELQNALRHAGY